MSSLSFPRKICGKECKTRECSSVSVSLMYELRAVMLRAKTTVAWASEDYLQYAPLHIMFACSQLLTCVAFFFAFFLTDFREKRETTFLCFFINLSIFTVSATFQFCFQTTDRTGYAKTCQGNSLILEATASSLW